LAETGVEQVVGVVLAPHYSRLSVGEYAQRAAAAAAELGIELVMVESWHLEPGYVELLAGFVHEAVSGLDGANPVEVVFTAHSLPQRILGEGDPYPQQLTDTARVVAGVAGVERWSVGWQSAGRTPEPWIGPDILEVVRTKAGEGVAGLVVCPAGFVSDHLEVLYDVDIEARAEADRVGLVLTRTRMPNDHPAFAAALACVVKGAVDG
jgi:ferrochelatase